MEDDADVLHHTAPFIPPDTLAKLSSVLPVFFREHMKDVYTSLSFIKRDRQMKKLLLHLGWVRICILRQRSWTKLNSDSESNVACWVHRVHIRPWLVQPRSKSPRSRTENLIIFFSKLFIPDYTKKVAQKRLQKRLEKDKQRVTSAFEKMRSVQEYDVDWDNNKKYHPEFYRSFVAPALKMWSSHLLKLTLKIPPDILNSLAAVQLPVLQSFCFTFSTANLSIAEIDVSHSGFLVFVNNLKSSLRSLSFMSTNTSENFDMCRIFRFLGTFPFLQSVSISIPFDGGHLTDPLLFLRFLERHRNQLCELNLFTNLITVGRGEAGNPARFEWTQRILGQIHESFPCLHSFGVTLRPLKHPLKTVTNFIHIHSNTLTELKLMDRSLNANEIGTLFGSPRLLTMLHIRVDGLEPQILTSIASYLPNLETLQLICKRLVGNWLEPLQFNVCSF